MKISETSIKWLQLTKSCSQSLSRVWLFSTLWTVTHKAPLSMGFFFLFYFIFKLYIIVLVLPNIKMNPPQVYMCSPSWTLLPPPSPYHPSGSSQCTSPKHPASCIEPGLATRFIHDILHVSMPFSQIFPPSPSPTEFIRLFYTSVGFFRQECQSVFAIPPPGHLPDPETKPAFPMSPALAGRFFTTEPLGKLLTKYYSRIIFK